VTTIPSIKGSIFASVVEDVHKAVSSGAVRKEELARWLGAADVALLDAKILVSNWYDIRSYDHMNQLLRDVVGDGGNEYLRERGRETARKLGAAGIYAQMEYLQRTEVSTSSGPARFEAFGRDLRKITTISASILNFSRWAPRPDPDHGDRWLIEVTEARDFPETLAWRSDGFVNGMSARHSRGDLWRWERAAPDRIVFRMQRAS
jgi:hypothetical protein